VPASGELSQEDGNHEVRAAFNRDEMAAADATRAREALLRQPGRFASGTDRDSDSGAEAQHRRRCCETTASGSVPRRAAKIGVHARRRGFCCVPSRRRAA